MKIKLNKHDQKLFENVRMIIKEVYESANFPKAVIKKIISNAMKYRNRGRLQAMRKYPFRGVCEASGKPLKKEDAHFDEIEPEKGYSGQVRWVCPKANNSGRRSCGGC